MAHSGDQLRTADHSRGRADVVINVAIMAIGAEAVDEADMRGGANMADVVGTATVADAANRIDEAAGVDEGVGVDECARADKAVRVDKDVNVDESIGENKAVGVDAADREDVGHGVAERQQTDTRSRQGGGRG